MIQNNQPINFLPTGEIMDIIFYLTVAAIFAASIFVFLFQHEAGIMNAYFDEKYKKVLDDAASLAASDPNAFSFDTSHRDSR